MKAEIEALTAAMNNLTAALNNQNLGGDPAAPTATTVEDVETPAQPEVRNPDKLRTEIHSNILDMVRNNPDMRPKIKQLLSEFGVKTVAKIPKESLAKCANELTKLGGVPWEG